MNGGEDSFHWKTPQIKKIENFGFNLPGTGFSSSSTSNSCRKLLSDMA